jgi:hypothetical protein
LVFCQNVFSLFPDGRVPELAMELLTKFPDCMRDKVNYHAASEEHKKQYAVRVKAAILSIRRGTKKNQMPSQQTNLALAHARTSELASNCLKGDARVTYSSLTKWRRQKNGKKRNMQPGECLDIITCPLF